MLSTPATKPSRLSVTSTLGSVASPSCKPDRRALNPHCIACGMVCASDGRKRAAHQRLQSVLGGAAVLVIHLEQCQHILGTGIPKTECVRVDALPHLLRRGHRLRTDRGWFQAPACAVWEGGTRLLDERREARRRDAVRQRKP